MRRLPLPFRERFRKCQIFGYPLDSQHFLPLELSHRLGDNGLRFPALNFTLLDFWENHYAYVHEISWCRA
jgi:hypothetical protein